MASDNEAVILERKRTIVSALCKSRSLDATKFLEEVRHDLKSLSVNIMKTAYENNVEFNKWVTFAENFPSDSVACLKGLHQLNEHLIEHSVLVGGGYRSSDADIIVFSTVHPHVISLSSSDRNKLSHLMRWIDYIQLVIRDRTAEEENSTAEEENNLPRSSAEEEAEQRRRKKEEAEQRRRREASKEEAAFEGEQRRRREASKGVKHRIQSTHDFGELFERIVLDKAPFDPPLAKHTGKGEVESSTKKAELNTKKAVPIAKATISGSDLEKKSDVSNKQATGKTEAAKEKKLPDKVPDVKDKELSVSLLKIQVGLIRNASKHPSADSLLVEEIDVGEGKCRQVVSGLAKYCSPDELTNRLVALITNVKPGKLRDVVSEGLVLCASNADHTTVEPLIVPEGAKIGECITFFGHEGKPEDVLNPKKKQLDKITTNLFTDDKGVATFKGVPFMTSAGPCTSTISNASIK